MPTLDGANPDGVAVTQYGPNDPNDPNQQGELLPFTPKRGTGGGVSATQYGPNDPNDPNQQGELLPETNARLTFYTRFDDGPQYENGSTAAPSPATGKRLAQEGVTIAVDPKKIPYGSRVSIPALKDFSANKDGIFIAHDTGGAVRSMKASGGKSPVLDVYVDGTDKESAQRKRDQIAKAFGTDAVIYRVMREGPAWGELGSNSLKAAGETVAHSMAKTAEGAAQFNEPGVRVKGYSPEEQTAAAEAIGADIQGLKRSMMHAPEDFRATIQTEIDAKERQRAAILQNPQGVPSNAAAFEDSRWFKDIAENVPTTSGVDPALESHPATQIARGLAMGGMMAAEAAVPFVGLPLMTGQAALEGRATAQDHTMEQLRGQGMSEEEALPLAQAAGEDASVDSLIGAAIFGAQNKAVAGALGRVIPEGAGALKTFMVQALGQTAGNTATSAALRAYDAAQSAAPGNRTAAAWEALKAFELQGLSQDAGFGVVGGIHAAAAARKAGAVRAVDRQQGRYGLEDVDMPTPEWAAGGVDPLAVAPVAEGAAEGATVARPNAMLEEQIAAGKAMDEFYRAQRQAQEAPPFDPSKPFEVVPDEAAVGAQGREGVARTPEEIAAEQEHRAAMEAELGRADADLGGTELVDAIREAGGLPSKSSPEYGVFRGELDNLMESSRGGKAAEVAGQFFGDLFRKDAPRLDELVGRLQDRGFDVQTANDVFDLLDQRQRTGKPVYGYDPELVPFSMRKDSTRREDIGEVISAAREDVKEKVWTALPKIDAQAVRDVLESGGPDLSGAERMVDNFAMRHMMKNHSDPARERARGQVPLTWDDMRRLPELAAHPDASRYLGKNARGLDLIMHIKHDGNWVFYIEEARSGNRLASASMRKRPAASDAEAPLSTPEALRSKAMATLDQEVANVKRSNPRLSFRASPGEDRSGTWKPEQLRIRTEAFQRIANQFMAKHFGEGLPPVEVVPDLKGGANDPALQQARAHSRRGYRIEAFLDPFKKGKRIVVVAGNIASEAMLKQKILHELVGHYGLEHVLREKDAARFFDVTEGVWRKFEGSRFSPEWQEGHGYQTLAELARNYGFDPETKVGRARTAVEHLARMAEADPRVSWVRRVIAQLRDVLRRAFPSLKMEWSDRDVLALLDRTRRGLEEGTAGGNDVAFSAKPSTPFDMAAPVTKDENGKPKDFFHGTTSPRALVESGKFDISYASPDALYGPGFYFTDNPAIAGGYASKKSSAGPSPGELAEYFTPGKIVRGHGHQDRVVAFHPTTKDRGWSVDVIAVKPDGSEIPGERVRRHATAPDARLFERPGVIPVHLDVRNPFDADSRSVSFELAAAAEKYGIATDELNISIARENGVYRALNRLLDGDREQVNALLQEAGYDGITHIGGGNTDNAPHRVVIAFHPEQIYGKYGGAERKAYDQAAFSMSPPTREAAAERAENRDGDGPEKQRGLVKSMLAAPGVRTEVKEKLDAYYHVLSNKEAAARAAQRIDELGIERALAEVSADMREGRVHNLSGVMAIDLHGRLLTMGRLEEGIALAELHAETMTTVGQATQQLKMISMLTPEGLVFRAAKLVQKGLKDAPAKVREAAEHVQRIKTEMGKARYGHATGAVISVQDLLRAAKLGPEKMVEAQQRLREALMQSGELPGVARDRIVGLLMAYGMDRGAAERLAGRAIAEFRKQASAARDAMLKQLLKVNTPKQTIPKAMIEKWLALNRAGALDNEKLFGEIAKKFGFPVFTQADGKRIQALQAIYERQSDPVLKLVAGARMMAAVNELVPPGILSRVRSVQNMAMLLNPKTAIRNIGGNVTMWGMNLAVDSVRRWTIDPLLSVVTHQRTITTVALGEQLKGLASPVVDFQKGFELAKSEGAGLVGSLAEGVRTMMDMARLVSGRTFESQQISGTYRKIWSNRGMRLLEDTMTLLHSVTDRAFYESKLRASMRQSMEARRANGHEDIAPTLDDVERAHWDAAQATYKNPNFLAGAFQRVRKAINWASTGGITERYGIGSVVVPFVEVPTNLILRGAEFTPAGLIKVGYEVLRPFLLETRLGNRVGRAIDKAAGLERGEGFDQRAFGDALTRVLVGTGSLVSAGFYLYRLGVITGAPEDDRDMEAFRRSSGWGGYRINLSELKRRFLSGNFWAPGQYHQQDGDVVRNYDWLQPLALPVAMGADFARAREKQALAHEQGKIAVLSAGMAGLWSGVKSLESQPLLQGLSKMARDVGQFGWGEGMARQVAQVPRAFVPAVVREVRDLTDNTRRELRGGTWLEAEGNRFLADLPWVSKRFPPKLDAFGQAQERYQAGSNTLFNVLANPAFVTTVRNTAIGREIEKVYAATGKSMVPNELDKKIVVNGRQLAPTNDQLADYRYFTGRFALNVFGKLVASPQFAEKTPEYKAKLMGEVLSTGAQLAKMAIFGHIMTQEEARAIDKMDPEVRENTAAAIQQIQGRVKGALPQYVRPK